MELPETPALGMPIRPIRRLTDPIRRFLHIEAASGVVLLTATCVALGLANSPWSEYYLAFWHTEFGFTFGHFELTHSLKHWINDGLMGIFFFVIGLEVKRELVTGELRDRRRAALPIFAAIGGMLVPAVIYLSFQFGEPGERGWGIPMATDIAFVVGCMAILGSRIPPGLRILLLSLAIADDIGAILVIAIGYSSSLHLDALILGFVGIAFVHLMARVGIRSILAYTGMGGLVWFAFHESGIHATLAGVILGLMTPTREYLGATAFRQLLGRADDICHGQPWPEQKQRASQVATLRRLARETISPVEYLENALHPWVSFLIMPVFALANAGVPFGFQDLADPVAQAVAFGLVIGKPVGVVLLCFLAVRLGIASLPIGVTWPVLAAGGLLAGIGFTMALFIADLALVGDMLSAAKVGVLAASAVAAVAGTALLRWLLPKNPATPGIGKQMPG